jgi:hypothetical protein
MTGYCADIVRVLSVLLLLLQQRGFCFSGSCQTILQKIKKTVHSKEALLPDSHSVISHNPSKTNRVDILNKFLNISKHNFISVLHFYALRVFRKCIYYPDQSGFIS